MYIKYYFGRKYFMQKLDKNSLYKNVVSSIESDIKYGNISGAAVLVAQNGEVLLNEYLGYSDSFNQIPLKENALFRLASMTKPVTAIAALIGVQNGWFSLDDKISKHFPEFENMYIGRLENGKVVPDRKHDNTAILRQLLSHDNGFMASNELYLPQEYDMPIEAFETNETAAYYCLNNTCLCFAPGSASKYSGYFAFDLIGLLIERHSGIKYAEFINKNIFEPLGITDITYNPTDEQWSRMVAMSDRGCTGIRFNVEMGKHTFEGFPLSYTCAGAGLVGSVEDYFKFAEMLRNNGAPLVSPEIFALMPKKYVAQELMHPDEKYSWGLGVRVTNGDPYLPDGTFGWSGAYGTHFFIDPENQITAIYMKNSRWHDAGGGGQTSKQFEKDIIESLK